MPAAVLNPSTHQDESAEAKAAFHLRLRARGVRDLAVLRAFETVPRDRFVPERYTAMAARDLPLPIACGQTTHEPWLLARAVEALAVEPGHRVLEVGSGSGYVTAVMAQLAGEVLGLERWASLAEAAQARLDALEAEERHRGVGRRPRHAIRDRMFRQDPCPRRASGADEAHRILVASRSLRCRTMRRVGRPRWSRRKPQPRPLSLRLPRRRVGGAPARDSGRLISRHGSRFARVAS